VTPTEIIYGIFFQPVSTLRYLKKGKPLLGGLLLFFCVILLNMIINRGLGILESQKMALAINADLFWIWVLLGPIFSLIILFIMAGLSSLLSEVVYGKANAVGLLVCLSFASVPGVLGPPLQYAAVLLGLSGLASFVALGVFVWVMVLQVLSLREALALQTGQAIFIYLLPLITMSLIFMAVFFILFSILPFSA